MRGWWRFGVVEHRSMLAALPRKGIRKLPGKMNVPVAMRRS